MFPQVAGLGCPTRSGINFEPW